MTSLYLHPAVLAALLEPRQCPPEAPDAPRTPGRYAVSLDGLLALAKRYGVEVSYGTHPEPIEWKGRHVGWRRGTGWWALYDGRWVVERAQPTAEALLSELEEAVELGRLGALVGHTGAPVGAGEAG